MTWILTHKMEVSPGGDDYTTTAGEWSDSDVEQAAKNMKNNPENYIDMIDVVSEFLPQPISDALWHNLSYTSITQSNIRLNRS